MLTDKFLEYIAVEKRYSANTVAAYRKDLADFRRFLMETEGTDAVESACKRAVRNFIASSSEAGLSRRSINRKLSSLRSFFQFLLIIGEIKVSPMENIEALKFYPEKQIPFSQDEMALLKSEIEPEMPQLQRLIIEMLYQTGMRKAELCGLRLSDIDASKCELTVTGKGNKTRIIPVSEALLTDLQSYEKTRKPVAGHENIFFLNSKGKKLDPKFVYSAVKSYLSLASSKKKRSPHILRHSFATHVLENGAEISKVKQLMGHQSLASTQVYTDASIEQLKKVFRQAHPRARQNHDGEKDKNV